MKAIKVGDNFQCDLLTHQHGYFADFRSKNRTKYV